MLSHSSPDLRNCHCNCWSSQTFARAVEHLRKNFTSRTERVPNASSAEANSSRVQFRTWSNGRAKLSVVKTKRPWTWKRGNSHLSGEKNVKHQGCKQRASWSKRCEAWRQAPGHKKGTMMHMMRCRQDPHCDFHIGVLAHAAIQICPELLANRSNRVGGEGFTLCLGSVVCMSRTNASQVAALLRGCQTCRQGTAQHL